MFKRFSQRKAASTSLPGSGLQVCAQCRGDHVHPVDWHEAGDEHWWMLLRCGGCAAVREVTVPNDVAERYGDDLDAARRMIEALVSGLEGERMAHEVEVFAEALRRDLIDAADFARRADW